MGTGNQAVNSAQAANQQQQLDIQNAVQQVNQAYNSPQRAQQIDNYGTHLQDYYTGQVNNQEAINARNLKFAMARSGLTGGSAATDSNNQLQQDYTKGLLAATGAANAGKTALEQADIQSKNNLIGLANQGGYTGVIPQQTSEAMNANLQSAQNYGNANALGNLFGGTAQIYNTEQVAAANRKAQQTPIGSIYGGTSTGGASPYQ